MHVTSVNCKELGELEGLCPSSEVNASRDLEGLAAMEDFPRKEKEHGIATH